MCSVLYVVRVVVLESWVLSGALCVVCVCVVWVYVCVFVCLCACVVLCVAHIVQSVV